MTGEPKRHHVVPEFYLRRFARHDGKRDKITVVRRSAEPKTMNVLNAGVVGKFNTIIDREGNPSLVVEELFQTFEDSAKRIMEMITRSQHIPMHGERSMLAEYMALQYLRTPEWRAVTNIETEIHAKALMRAQTDEELRATLRRMNGREPTDGEFAAQERVRDHIDGFTIEASPGIFFKQFLETATEDIMPHLVQNLHWDLLETDAPVFITSDHPIVFPRPPLPMVSIGITTAPIIYFPIDPFRVLRLAALPVCASRLLTPKTEAIREINQLIADNFYEWIAYHPEQQGALAGLDIAENPPPLMGYNSTMVYGDKRGIDKAVSERLHMMTQMRRSEE